MEQHDSFDNSSPEWVDEPEERSPVDRFVEVFTSPAEAFSGLRQSERKGATIGMGILLAALVTAAASILVLVNPKLVEEVKAKQLEQMEKAYDEGKIDKKTYEKIVNDTQDLGLGTMLLFQLPAMLIGLPIGWLIMSGVMLGVMNLLDRDRDTPLKYSTALATYVVAIMIPTVGRVLQFIGAYATSNAEFSPDLSLVVPTGDNLFLKSMLSLTNPFEIWWMIVAGIGIAVVTKAARGKAIAYWVVAWIVVTLIYTSIGTFFRGTFGG